MKLITEFENYVTSVYNLSELDRTISEDGRVVSYALTCGSNEHQFINIKQVDDDYIRFEMYFEKIRVLSFASVAVLCCSFTTLPPGKRKCVKTSYFSFCFLCASYCSRVIHFGLFSILFRSSLLRSLSILSSITERYFINSFKSTVS